MASSGTVIPLPPQCYTHTHIYTPPELHAVSLTHASTKHNQVCQNQEHQLDMFDGILRPISGVPQTECGFVALRTALSCARPILPSHY